jgi:hypothetical protein
MDAGQAEARLAVLERQVLALRREVTRFDHWHDTCHSPLYKRLWWWAQGYRFFSLGRWYRAPWNQTAAKYEVTP